VSYFPSEQILAIPIHSESGRGGFFAGVDNTTIFERGEGGLQIFSVDTETGFESLALIEHDSPILRSLRIGETLFAFSAGEITTNDLTGTMNQLDSLKLLIGSETRLVELTAYRTLPTAADLRAIGLALGYGTGNVSATADVLDATQIVANEGLFPELLSARFNVAFSKVHAADYVFSANAEESLFILDDTLLEELVCDLLDCVEQQRAN